MQKKARVGSGNSMRYLHCHFYRADLTRIHKAAQLRGLFRIFGCSPRVSFRLPDYSPLHI